MKKIELNGLDATVYHEQLENGLSIYLVPYQDKNNYFITYATRFGSNDTIFKEKDKKKETVVPDGIAHFLEHKVFAQEDGSDPFAFYSKTGTGVNASTSFDNTQYVCYGNKNLLENLDYLLSFVDVPYFTDENVEKEKGIIKEEIKMYDDIPEWVLELELRKSLYHSLPIRVDIAGDVKSIDKIEKEDLYTCYQNFYQPKNMFLIVAGKMDVEEVLEVIKKREENRVNQKEVPKKKKYDEKDEVVSKEKKLKMKVELPKIGYAIKVNTKKLSIKDNFMIDTYLNMLLTLGFGMSSKFREEARREQLMSAFYFQKEAAEHFRSLVIMAESEHPEKFLERLKDEFNHLELKEEDFERMKKVWIASEVQMIDNVETTVDNLYDDILHYGKVFQNKLELIRKMDFATLQIMIEEIDFNQSSAVVIYPVEEKKENEKNGKK